MDAKSLVNLVNDFGFPVVLAVLMMGFIWYMFKYVTNELKPKLGEANGVLIGLIRLKTKIETVKKQKAKKK